MTKKQITAFALKFFAMYLFANILFVLPQALLTQTLLSDMLKRVGESGSGIALAWAVGGFVMTVGIVMAAILWRLSNSLVSTTSDGNTSTTPPFSLKELEPLIVTGIGLFFVIDAISSLGYYGVNLFDIPKAELAMTSVANIVVSLVLLIIAGSMVAYPIWWSNIFRKSRSDLSSNNTP